MSLRAICKGSTASSDTHELLMRHFCHFRPLPMTSVKANSWLAVLPGHLPALLLGSEDRGGPPPPLPSDKALATTASTTCATTANTTIAPAAASDAASDAASAASSSSASSSIIDPARYVKAEYGSSAVSPSEVRATVRGCSVVVGMHPDEATGAAVVGQQPAQLVRLHPEALHREFEVQPWREPCLVLARDQPLARKPRGDAP